MIIGLVGYTDKRPVIYPLLKILQTAGESCFITRDRRYLRLTENHENLGHYQNIMIVVTDEPSDQMWENLELNPSAFDHVVYDISCDDLPEKLDLVYICHTIQPEEGEEDFWECLPENNTKHLKFMYDNTTIKDATKVPISSALWKYCETVESLKVMPSFTDSSIAGFLSKDLATYLNVTPQLIVKILKEDWK